MENIKERSAGIWNAPGMSPMQPTMMGPTPPNPAMMPWFLFSKTLKQNAAKTQEAEKKNDDMNSKKAIELYSQLSNVNGAINRLKTVLTETRRMVPNPAKELTTIIQSPLQENKQKPKFKEVTNTLLPRFKVYSNYNKGN